MTRSLVPCSKRFSRVPTRRRSCVRASRLAVSSRDQYRRRTMPRHRSPSPSRRPGARPSRDHRCWRRCRSSTGSSRDFHFARRIRAFIHQHASPHARFLQRTLFRSQLPSAGAALDGKPTGAPAFRAFLRHRSILMLFLRQSSAVARYPPGTGSAQILRSMSPNSRPVRCPSASRSQ